MDIEKYYDQIEAYLSNSMTLEQKEVFEKDMSKEPDLKRAVFNHVLANEALGLTIEDRIAGKLKKLELDRNIGQEKSAPQITWRKRLAIAASVLLLILAGMFIWSNQNYSNQSLAANLYAESTIPTVRNDGETNQNLNQGILAFNQKDYDTAIAALSEITSKDIAYKEAEYILAHAYWHKRDDAKANYYFSSLLNEENLPASIDRQELEWNQLLTTLKEKGADSQAFKEALATIQSNSNHAFYLQANDLSKKLTSFWRVFSLSKN